MKRRWPWVVLAVIAVLAAVRLFWIGMYNIPAGSMIPTLKVGDGVLINLLQRHPARGDVIVFQYPKDPDKDFIKRVIGVGGDTVEVRQDRVFVNDAAVKTRALAGACSYDDFDESTNSWSQHSCAAFEEQLDGPPYRVVYEGGPPRDFAKIKIPDGQLFVMGDNRNNSSDSRFWGFVPLDHVRGTLWRVWYSPRRK